MEFRFEVDTKLSDLHRMISCVLTEFQLIMKWRRGGRKPMND